MLITSRSLMKPFWYYYKSINAVLLFYLKNPSLHLAFVLRIVAEKHLALIFV